jgi:hypothetical protein
MMIRLLLGLMLVITGCSSKTPSGQISGTVTFKGSPVPAGEVTFTPDVTIANGQVRQYVIKEGKYDSSANPDDGLLPGRYRVRIAGYDGKQVPMFYSGKQICNAIEQDIDIGLESATKDFVVPESAGENIQYIETADF